VAFYEVYQPNGKDKARMHPSSQDARDAVKIYQLFTAGRMVAGVIVAIIMVGGTLGILNYGSRLSVLEENDKATSAAIDELKKSISGLGEKMDSKFDGLNSKIDSGFSRVESRFERTDGKILDLVSSGKLQKTEASAPTASYIPPQSVEIPAEPVKKPAKKGSRLVQKAQPTLWQTITGQ
jgi:hypothetical protein